MFDKRKAIIAFLAGADGALFLFIFLLIFPIPFTDTTSPLTLVPLLFLTAGVLEEGIKFLLVKRWGEFPYYAIFLGLGYGLFEQYFRHGVWLASMGGFGRLLKPDYLVMPGLGVVMQTVFAVVMAYFIKKGKPALGLAIAVISHTLLDVLLLIK